MSFPSAAQKRPSARRIALIVTAVFVAAGVTWVLITDILLYAMAGGPVLIARIETAKGWTFVALAGALIYAVTLRSATRVTRAQALTSAIIDSIGDGVLLLGPDRTIVHANPAALRMLRCERLEDVVGMGAVEFSRRFCVSYPDGSLVPPERYVSQRVYEEAGPLQYRAVIHPPGGPDVDISSTAAAVRDAESQEAHMVVSVMHDISASERFERLRDQFFAGAAHSLKTPVAIIKANAQVLSQGASPQLRRSAGALERQCERIDRLVQNLLVLSRIRSQTLQLYPGEVELGPFVEQITKEMAKASFKHEVRTEVIDAARVRADPERLAMVLRNVLDEALRSSTSGSPLTVLLRQHGPDAEIGVRYQPLPAEERTCAGYGDYDDLGLGRCVARMIVQAHGGALREETTDSETTAWIGLPTVEEPRGHA